MGLDAGSGRINSSNAQETSAVRRGGNSAIEQIRGAEAGHPRRAPLDQVGGTLHFEMSIRTRDARDSQMKKSPLKTVGNDWRVGAHIHPRAGQIFEQVTKWIPI